MLLQVAGPPLLPLALRWVVNHDQIINVKDDNYSILDKQADIFLDHAKIQCSQNPCFLLLPQSRRFSKAVHNISGASGRGTYRGFVLHK